MLLEFVTPVMWAKFEASRSKFAARVQAKKETEPEFLNFKETEEDGRGKRNPGTVTGSAGKK